MPGPVIDDTVLVWLERILTARALRCRSGQASMSRRERSARSVSVARPAPQPAGRMTPTTVQQQTRKD